MTIEKLPTASATTIRNGEVERFNRLAATWWDSALHQTLRV